MGVSFLRATFEDKSGTQCKQMRVADASVGRLGTVATGAVMVAS
jgi:hypothetical protein